MAAARAAALGVRWLQRTTRGVVPLEARRGPQRNAPRPPRSITCEWKTTSHTPMMAWGMATTRCSPTDHSMRGIRGISGTTQNSG
uniref:NADH:ubiquinone oxidoreductase subunit B8 n=1 Tax=Mus musculus TaxID=10090 RepID=E9PY23_MOUSE